MKTFTFLIFIEVWFYLSIQSQLVLHETLGNTYPGSRAVTSTHILRWKRWERPEQHNTHGEL